MGHDPFKDDFPIQAPAGYNHQASAADTRTEPVFNACHLRTVSVNNTLAEVREAPAVYGVQPVPHGQPRPQRGPPRVQFAPDDPTPLFGLAHIPKNHPANLFFNRNQVRYGKNMAWLWGTYGALR